MAYLVPISTLQTEIQSYAAQSSQTVERLVQKMTLAQECLAEFGKESGELDQSRGKSLEQLKAWKGEEQAQISQLEKQIAKCEAAIREKLAFLQKVQGDPQRATNVELWELRRQLHAYTYCVCYHQHSYTEPTGAHRSFSLNSPQGLSGKKDLQKLVGRSSLQRDDGAAHAYVMGFTRTDQEGWKQVPGPHPETQGYSFNYKEKKWER